MLVDEYNEIRDYKTNIIEGRKYLVTFVDGDGNRSYASLNVYNDDEIIEKCEAYSVDKSLPVGDVTLSGCFRAYADLGHLSNYSLDSAYYEYNKKLPGELLEITFYYDAPTVKDFYTDKVKGVTPHVVFYLMIAVGCVVGIVACVAKKRKSEAKAVNTHRNQVGVYNSGDYIHSKIITADGSSAQRTELITKFAKEVREIMIKKSNDDVIGFGNGADEKTNTDAPVRVEGTTVYLDSAALIMWKMENPHESGYGFKAAILCKEKEPILSLVDDGVKTREYRLQTENGEDFTGKYFMISVRLAITGMPPLAIAQMDGFISDTPEERTMTRDDIGYRMEGYFLSFGGEMAKLQYDAMKGKDLPMKGLKYPGYTTPSNVRLIGFCPDCKKSFAFHEYSFYMAQSDVAYSDDGLDVCEIVAYDIDKENWSYEVDSKTFRYYNSFCCPHCGSAYIDYKNNPQMKTFGVSGCVHVGRKHYQYL